MKPPELDNIANMIRPPVNRLMQQLDRSLFQKTVPLAIAKVRDRKQISKLRHDLWNDMLRLERLHTVHDMPEPGGQTSKGLLLRPEIVANGKLRCPLLVSKLVIEPLRRCFHLEYVHCRARQSRTS